MLSVSFCIIHLQLLLYKNSIDYYLNEEQYTIKKLLIPANDFNDKVINVNK